MVGAGIFGLATAWALTGRGARVLVVEAARLGAGASGGLVGALSPHAPEKWNAKKAYQLTALLDAEAYWANVAAASGIAAGYGRIGRLQPLATERAASLGAERVAGAARHWEGRAVWQVLAAPPEPGWLAPRAAPHGVVWDTLSARIAPRRAIAALAGAIRARGSAVWEGWPVTEATGDGVAGPEGRLAAGAVVLATGALAPALPGGDLVTGVKGQAALLDAEADGMPTLYADGIYIVPQMRGGVAVGSTSETEFADATGTDAALDTVIATARRLCPRLATAPVLERWAGVRPRGVRPDPMLGPMLGSLGDRLFVANGGFKIGLALAPRLGAAMADWVLGDRPALPETFTLDHHRARRRQDQTPHAHPE